MNYKILRPLAFNILFLACAQVDAADLLVTDLIQFNSGDPSSASDVNTNFETLRSAVNTKQDKVVGSCSGGGQAIAVINDDGTVVCEPDSDSGGDITDIFPGAGLSGGGSTGSVTLSIAPGNVSVAGVGFHDSGIGGCVLSLGNQTAEYSSGNSCVAFSPIQLPHGAEVTGMSCLVLDNNSDSFSTMFVRLHRKNLLTGENTEVAVTSTSVDSVSLQTISFNTSSIPAGNGDIDNANFAYALWASFGSGTLTSLALHGCTIEYQYP